MKNQFMRPVLSGLQCTFYSFLPCVAWMNNQPCAAEKTKTAQPNIIIIMADDMGFSDIGCYGGEIQTPHIDKLAARGMRFRTFYNNAKSCPTRASLLTGLYNHEAGMGNMVVLADRNIEPGPYQGFLNNNCITIAEALGEAGYATYLSGKWHLGERKEHWPLQRGFDKYFGLISGASSYFEIIKEPRMRTMAYDNESWTPPADGFYMTDAISDSAVSFVASHLKSDAQNPFFLYVAYTSPHWPLHALEKDIQKYNHVYSPGWDEIRQERYRNMLRLGIIEPDYQLSPRSPQVAAWNETEAKDLWERRMQVYAAMIDCMDQGIGRLIDELEKTGVADNTLILFLSDNGGCAEVASTRNLAIPDIPVGEKGSYDSYLEPWANVSNTPFRFYKNWLYEGGVRTPFIMCWPGNIYRENTISAQTGHITDIMATCLDAAGATYPESYRRHPVKPLRGMSLLPALSGKVSPRDAPMFWEYAGEKAMIDGEWKIVQSKGAQWELYQLANDPTELHNLADEQPAVLGRMKRQYAEWEKEVGVQPVNK